MKVGACECIRTELCYNVVATAEGDGKTEPETESILQAVLCPNPFKSNQLTTGTSLSAAAAGLNDDNGIGNNNNDKDMVLEFGPRFDYASPFSTNAVSLCRGANLHSIVRLELSTRYLLRFTKSLDAGSMTEIKDLLHDKMRECEYGQGPGPEIDAHSFLDSRSAQAAAPIQHVPILDDPTALRRANVEMGLALDDWDIQYYNQLFRTQIGRNPTDVELFDLAQSNSEHSRHWFFKGKIIVDGVEEPENLFSMIMATQKTSNPNNVIAFSDNSSLFKSGQQSGWENRLAAHFSAIKGYEVDKLSLTNLGGDEWELKTDRNVQHLIFTAETHNFPTGVCPFPGAATGTGGRIRDVQAAGRGGNVVAGFAGYSFGHLRLPDYELPWEMGSQFDRHPSNFAHPRDVAIQASNGASDYGNKFGEPVIGGFARSYGGILSYDSENVVKTERSEYIKPIMFSAGIGTITEGHVDKLDPEKDMDVVKVGGPVYSIGLGGGAASSVHVQGDDGSRQSELDFGAVQRGDPEMGQKLNRVVRCCIEMNEANPILSIHDQGAGGNANVLKELVEGVGAVIHADKFHLGDPNVGIRELWGAEYQESNAFISKPESRKLLAKMARRERCSVDIVGTVTGNNQITLMDFDGKNKPVDLDLEMVLAKMPQKEFHLNKQSIAHVPLSLPTTTPSDVSAAAADNPSIVNEMLTRVLRHPSVASKRYLTNKVDRSVTGLIASQQCVGSLHTPLADVAVTALSHFDTVGSAVGIGEQPIKGLIDPRASARLSLAEALTNLVFAPITDLKDVKCSGNWMWPAKLPGEGYRLLEACKAMCETMSAIGVAVDGGKDSLSMAAKVGGRKDGGGIVKSPGTLVISAYAPCTDITRVVTPDLKCPNGKGRLLHVVMGCPDLLNGVNKRRLGGTILASVYSQLGSVVPDLDDPGVFRNAFAVTQKLMKDGTIVAGHDISDGGFLVCALEMAFAGNCSLKIELNKPSKSSSLAELLFHEEPGIVIEIDSAAVRETEVIAEYEKAGVQCYPIGFSSSGPDSLRSKIEVSVSGESLISETTSELRDRWEETSYQLERLQSNPETAVEERRYLKEGQQIEWKCTFDYDRSLSLQSRCLGTVENQQPLIGIMREEGSNGDREMAAAFYAAGFRTFDVTMQDMVEQKVSLDRFRGLAFVGGFSYADVLGSAKGWSSSILHNEWVRSEFAAFKARKDTFSFGVCNGCQLMAHLGWIGESNNAGVEKAESTIFLDHNDSGRFESRFSSVRIGPSPSIMFKGMEDSVLGVWVAHGQGKFTYRSEAVLNRMESESLIPLKYVDSSGMPTERYPMNPNGSTHGVAGVCSADGRHLAIMPHPERCFLEWQWPYFGKLTSSKSPPAVSATTNGGHPVENGNKRGGGNLAPWIRMFTNAFLWTQNN